MVPSDDWQLSLSATPQMTRLILLTGLHRLSLQSWKGEKKCHMFTKDLYNISFYNPCHLVAQQNEEHTMILTMYFMYIFCWFAFKCSVKEKNVWSYSGCFLWLNVIQVTANCVSQWNRGEMSMEKRLLKSYYLTVKGWWWQKANTMKQRANGSMNPLHTDIAIFPLQLWLFLFTLF